MKRSIAVVGQGFVGSALSLGMCHSFDVYAYDISGKAAICNDDRGTIVNGAINDQNKNGYKNVKPFLQFISDTEENEKFMLYLILSFYVKFQLLKIS
jgi:nucleoside-diphosphate-sugar epimerase